MIYLKIMEWKIPGSWKASESLEEESVVEKWTLQRFEDRIDHVSKCQWNEPHPGPSGSQPLPGASVEISARLCHDDAMTLWWVRRPCSFLPKLINRGITSPEKRLRSTSAIRTAGPAFCGVVLGRWPPPAPPQPNGRLPSAFSPPRPSRQRQRSGRRQTRTMGRDSGRTTAMAGSPLCPPEGEASAGEAVAGDLLSL